MTANDRDALADESLGFVETMGLSAAIEAADAMGKAARVRVKTVMNADAGLISVVCAGDLAACVAAVDAGAAASGRMGGFLRKNVIARPFGDTSFMVETLTPPLYSPKPAQATQKPAKPKTK